MLTAASLAIEAGAVAEAVESEQLAERIAQARALAGSNHRAALEPGAD